MDKNITITRQEFAEYIALKTRAETIEYLIRKEGYISTDGVCAILGIEVEKDGEL